MENNPRHRHPAMDVYVPKKPLKQPQSPPKAPIQQVHAITQPLQHRPPEKTIPRKKRRLPSWNAIGAGVLAFVALIVALNNSTIGQWLVLVYGVIVIWRRIDSRQPFAAALVALIGIPFLTLIQIASLTPNLAIYAYELLVVGVIRAIIENMGSSRESRQKPAAWKRLKHKLLP